LCEGKNYTVKSPWMNEIIKANVTKDERRWGGERDEQ
jgi:hypothetical protein